jgi:hypothetical protein
MTPCDNSDVIPANPGESRGGAGIITDLLFVSPLAKGEI